MSSLRFARSAFRARPSAFSAPFQRRGYAEAVSDKIKLSLTLPHQTIFKSAGVVQVNIPAASGEMGVLANHVPSIEQLKPGLVEVVEEGNASKQFFLSGGFAVVQPDSQLSINTVLYLPFWNTILVFLDHVMADFSQYTGPSADWIALEPTIPPMPNLPILELRSLVNKGREELAAHGMKNIASQVQIQDYTIKTRDGADLEARTYRPSGIAASEKLPVYIHLHGGGYLFGTLSSEDAICSRIVVSRADNATPVVVVNINYRHTPEHTFPTAWNDVEDAFVWVHEHINDIGGLSDQVVVGGISAGAQLTLSLTLAQLYGDNDRVKACPKIRGQVLMIPCVVMADYYAPRKEMLRSPEVSSYVTCAEAPILPVSRIELFMSLLKLNKTPDAARDLRMNPGNATPEQVKNLPPTTFGIAGNDPLRDEGLFFGQLLSEKGVPTDVNVFPGVPHGFRRHGDKLSASKKWDEVMSGGITWALSNPAAGPFVIKAE